MNGTLKYFDRPSLPYGHLPRTYPSIDEFCFGGGRCDGKKAMQGCREFVRDDPSYMKSNRSIWLLWLREEIVFHARLDVSHVKKVFIQT